MPQIPDIRLNNLRIRDIGVQDVPRALTTNPPIAIPVYPPVTSQVGTPIVNMPGCVQAHKDNKENVNLKEEDDKGMMTLCDAGTPSFSPIDYDANKLDITQEAPPLPTIKSPEKEEEDTETDTEADTPPPPLLANAECPTREQQLKNPVGKLLQNNKKIVRYETVGKECLPVFENLNIPDQIVANLPSPGAVTVTASIAAVATTSALLAKPLADLLLKVVKPTVKKVIKKIAALRGKKIPPQSKGERQTEQRQRNHAVKALRSVRPLKK